MEHGRFIRFFASIRKSVNRSVTDNSQESERRFDMMIKRPSVRDIIGAVELMNPGERVAGSHDGGGLGDLLGAYELSGKHHHKHHPQHHGGHEVREKEPRKLRYHYIPMNSTGTVAAAAAAVVNTQPQNLAFKPRRIVVPASIAPDFTIDAIYCGITPQFVASGSIAAETFTQDAWQTEMDMDTVNTSQNFTLNVTNQSGAARQFRATVFGKTALD
jgi:hypothetical protein